MFRSDVQFWFLMKYHSWLLDLGGIFVQLGFTMKLTHLSPVQYRLIHFSRKSILHGKIGMMPSKLCKKSTTCCQSKCQHVKYRTSSSMWKIEHFPDKKSGTFLWSWKPLLSTCCLSYQEGVSSADAYIHLFELCTDARCYVPLGTHSLSLH